MMKKAVITLLILFCSLYASTIENFNVKIDELVSAVKNGDTNKSDTLLELLTKEALACDFEEIDKRMHDNSYDLPFLKNLPSSLDYETFINKEEQLRDKFNEVFDAIEDVQNKIAAKKYKTALKIIITGFNVYKSTIDLIKTDYSLYELVQLPSNLKETVEGYKKDAEIIQKKFDDIKDEKKKLEYLNDFKNKLVDLTYKIRNIRVYLQGKENELTKLSTLIKSCNNMIDRLKNLYYLEVTEDMTYADVSGYAKELNYLVNSLLNGKIGILQYKTRKEQIYEEIKDICSKVDECDGAEQISENFFQYCATPDVNEIKCEIPDPDTDKTYYLLELKVKYADNKYIIVHPTKDDFSIILTYKTRWDNFLSLKEEYEKKFDELISLINEKDFLLEEDDNVKRPVELREVNVKDEFDPLFNGKKPPECGMYDFDENFSNSVVLDFFNSNLYNEKTPLKGPNVLCGECPDNEVFFHSDLTKINWQNKMEDYFSYLEDYIKKLYHTAILSYSSRPNCSASFNHCKFALLLLPEYKIEDIAYNIRKLCDDAVDFSSDFKDMTHKLTDIKILANKLIELFKTLKGYENLIGFDDFNFEIFFGDNDKTKLFLHTKSYKTNLLGSYFLLNNIIASVEDAKSEAERMQKLSDDYYREWMNEYYDKIDDILSFNNNLKYKKTQFLNDAEELANMKNYTLILDSLRNDIKFLLGQLRRGKTDNIYDTVKTINENSQKFTAFQTGEYSEILKNYTALFEKIAAGGIESKDVFSGKYPLLEKYKSFINELLENYWPVCDNGYGRSDEAFEKYLNYDEIENKLPRLKKLIDTYYTDEYKPDYLKKSDIILTDSNVFPTCIKGKGKIKFYVKFKKLSGTFQPLTIELASAIPEENYIIKPLGGFYGLNEGEIKGKYYTFVNDRGEYKFSFELLSDKINITDNNGDVIDTIPIKDFYIRVYMRSDKTPTVKFEGEDKNAVMFHVLNLKYYKDYDKNENGVDDKWEDYFNITDIEADSDNDGVINKDEYTYGTNPNKKDSDDDGINDGDEIKNGLDPLIDDAFMDYDKDGITNLDEIKNGYDPKDKNSPADIVYGNAKQSGDNEIIIDLYVKNTKTLKNGTVKFSVPEGFEYVSCDSLMDGNVSCEDKEINILQLGSGQHHIAQVKIKRLDKSEGDFTLEIKSEGTLYGVDLKYKIPNTIPSYTFNLAKGWHLLANPFAEDINVSFFDKAEIVWVYRNGGWMGYSKKYNLEEYNISKLKKVKRHEGFWVYMAYNARIKTTGETLDETLFETLDKGWNLKGSKIDLPVKDIGFLFPEFEIVWTYENGKWKVFSKNDNINEEIKDKIEIMNSIRKYTGFWILAK